MLECFGGKITYYATGEMFVAVCGGHSCGAECKLSRTSRKATGRGAASRNEEGQGRPIGTLAAWLKARPLNDRMSALHSTN